MIDQTTWDKIYTYNQESPKDATPMDVIRLDKDVYALYIRHVQITRGDSEAVRLRVAQIFRENGLTLMF